VSDAGEFIDAALQYESSGQYRSGQEKSQYQSSERLAPTALQFYGTSVGAVRGIVRDAGRRYPSLGHDEITALSSELWNEPGARPVFERRLAAIVLLQSNLRLLDNTDLTRLEGFVRSASARALVDPLATDVISPMVRALNGTARSRADATVARWAADGDSSLARAAGIVTRGF
jgi:hypothetical protein